MIFPGRVKAKCHKCINGKFVFSLFHASYFVLESHNRGINKKYRKNRNGNVAAEKWSNRMSVKSVIIQFCKTREPGRKAKDQFIEGKESVL